MDGLLHIVISKEITNTLEKPNAPIFKQKITTKLYSVIIQKITMQINKLPVSHYSVLLNLHYKIDTIFGIHHTKC
jgi:hypothetical protein